MVSGLNFKFPSRGIFRLEAETLFFVPPQTQVTCEATSAPYRMIVAAANYGEPMSLGMQNKPSVAVRQCLPPSDGLIVLHAIRARRMADSSNHQQEICGRAQRKRPIVGTKDDRGPSEKRRRTSSTPSGLEDTMAPRQASSRDHLSYGRVVFTADALGQKTLADLKDVCRSRGLSVGGKKEQLVHRVLTSQLGTYPDGAEGP